MKTASRRASFVAGEGTRRRHCWQTISLVFDGASHNSIVSFNKPAGRSCPDVLHPVKAQTYSSGPHPRDFDVTRLAMVPTLVPPQFWT